MRSFRNWGMRLGLCLLCLMLLAQPVAAIGQSMPALSDSIYTSLVHYSASTGSAVIGQMENGTAVTVLEERGDFYKVDCYDTTGYIAKEQVKLRDGKYYVACNLRSDETEKMENTSLSDALVLRSAILALAEEQLGDPYVYGGIYPGGFDCSGLTYYVYGKLGYSLLRCADEQLRNGLIVAKEGLQVGDLVFFRESWSPWLASHVGIYAGNGQMIHAGSGGICYADLNADYYEDYYLCARRIINTKTAQIQNVPTASIESAAMRSQNLGIRTAN